MCNRVAYIKAGKIIKVEKISSLKENTYKKIKIEMDSNPGREFFDMPGVSKLETENNTLSFLFKGDINSIVRKISNIKISNLSIEEPDLDEIFMHYYKEG